MNRLTYIIIGMLAVSLTGCVTVEKVVKERVDRDVSGNRGYIKGSASQAPATTGPDEREYIDIKVEIPTLSEVKQRLPKAKTTKKEPARAVSGAGNRGYLEKNIEFEEELPPVPKEEPMPAKKLTPPQAMYEDLEEHEEESEEAYEITSAQTYTVKSGDSLSKIAKELYGKASKWTLIYEANADKIKDPNKIKEGTVLTIPALEDTESAYAK
jgi:nucleoid-associated protein YgaU